MIQRTLLNKNELMSELFGFSAPTYFRWKKENRPIIRLIDKYFSDVDLINFLCNESIPKMERFNLIEKERNQLFEIFDFFDNIQKEVIRYIIQKYTKQEYSKDLYNFIISIGLQNMVNEIINKDFDSLEENEVILSLVTPEHLYALLLELTEKIKKLSPSQVNILVNDYEELFETNVIL